jgi:hypothetical protein
MRVPRTEATNEERLQAPTLPTEKLYGGAPKIWDRVTAMPTSQDIQVVKRRVAQRTTGEASMQNGRMSVFQNETWLTYPL